LTIAIGDFMCFIKDNTVKGEREEERGRGEEFIKISKEDGRGGTGTFPNVTDGTEDSKTSTSADGLPSIKHSKRSKKESFRKRMVTEDRDHLDGFTETHIIALKATEDSKRTNTITMKDRSTIYFFIKHPANTGYLMRKVGEVIPKRKKFRRDIHRKSVIRAK
jgi:hypothetical protein